MEMTLMYNGRRINEHKSIRRREIRTILPLNVKMQRSQNIGKLESFSIRSYIRDCRLEDEN